MNGLNTDMGSPLQEIPANKEEQALYDAFVGNALNLLPGDENLKVVEGLAGEVSQTFHPETGEKDPVQGLANATVQVVRRVAGSARENGMDIPDEIKLHGGLEILEKIAELLEEKGIHDYSEEEMEAAFYRALDIYGTQEMESGNIDPHEAQADFQQLQQMNGRGQLDTVFNEMKRTNEIKGVQQ